MLKYTELIKFDITPITKNDRKCFNADNRLHKYNKNKYIVTASVVRDILVIDIFRCEDRTTQIAYRHFYDKHDNKYITQRIGAGKKGTGTIWNYFSGRAESCSNDTNLTILNYLESPNGESGIMALERKEQEILSAKRRTRHDVIMKRIDERMAVLPNEPPQAFYDWICDTAYINERYFIYTRESKAKKHNGVCTHCKTRFSAVAKNGGIIVCPKCGSRLICHSKGKSADRIQLWKNVSYVENVVDVDGSPAVVERVFYTVLTIDNIKHWETDLKTGLFSSEEERRFYNFERGFDLKSNSDGEYHYRMDHFLSTNVFRWCANKQGSPTWRRVTKIYPKNLNEIVNNDESELRNVDIEEVVKNITDNDFRDVCRALKEFPAIENLVKQGLKQLATDLIAKEARGYYSYCHDNFTKFVDISQKSAAGFLQVSRPEIKSFAEIDILPQEYALYMTTKQAVGKAELSAVHALFDEFGFDSWTVENEIADILQHGCRPQKIVTYLRAQDGLVPKDGVKGKDDLLTTFRDYLNMANTVYGGLNANTRYPQNLIEAHDKMTVLYEEFENAEHIAGLARRAELLDNLKFSDENFVIFPFRCLEDFTNESKVLSHCVKTYIDQCAEGSTNIFGLRKIDEPDEPYFTVNIDNLGELIQNRGKCNCAPPPEVSEFVGKWLKFVAKKLKKMSLEPNAAKNNNIKIGA